MVEFSEKSQKLLVSYEAIKRLAEVAEEKLRGKVSDANDVR
jgi:hypothetical protein